MPLRITPLVNNGYYHIYNRGVARVPTFKNARDYLRFFTSLDYYRFVKPPVKLSRFLQLPQSQRSSLLTELRNKNELKVDLLAYVLMPNHFHLMVRQVVDNGISEYINCAINSYAKYFNTKNDRVGSLFQGRFKSVKIESDEQLIHVSRYIHLNPLVSAVVRERDFLSYSWSSLSDYIEGGSEIVETKPVLAHFRSPKDYLNFVQDQIDYGRCLEEIKHLTLE